ncbi:hypothetical protein AB0M87_17170 [Streptomyces sp. NPDC051320]|uniref:hypothetical protein n=1 Tax=Streptomyces sp. NPDC051320 TaxID=3154644 RepID=UPI003445DC04
MPFRPPATWADPRNATVRPTGPAEFGFAPAENTHSSKPHTRSRVTDGPKKGPNSTPETGRAAAGAVALATTTGSLVLASPADAAVGCSVSHACLHYNSNLQGALLIQYVDIPDYAGYKFSASTSPNGGNGAGQAVKNNAASIDNWDPNFDFRVYYNSDYSARYASQTIPVYGEANLNSQMKNQNASGNFIFP